MIIPDVIEQHWEEASILWSRRCLATVQPSFNLRSLAQLDDRVEAHLDGLRIAGKEGWDLGLREATWEDAGEAFAFGVLSFHDDPEGRFDEVLRHATASPALARGLTSALGWLDISTTQARIHALLNAKPATERRIGLGAAAVQRLRLDRPLVDAFKDDDEQIRSRACRTVGELGQGDLLRLVQPHVASSSETCAFWAAWSTAVLVPDAPAMNRLRDFAVAESRWQMRAAQVFFRRLDLRSALAFHRELAGNPASARLAVSVAAIIGDPGLIPWLLEQMSVPERMRLAADAFQTITGADFVMDRLRNGTPPRPAVPEDTGGEYKPDLDGDLTWPSVNAIKEWWGARRDRFASGSRHLLGKPITMDSLREVLIVGQQHQRAAAALEMAIRQSGQPLFNVAMPGFCQQQVLSRGGSRQPS